MIFTVPEDFKGSFVLNSLKKAFSKGMTVSIDDRDLFAPDVKVAIKRGLLIPLGEEYDEAKAKMGNEVFIVNKTDKTLILGQFVIKKNMSIIVSKKDSTLPVLVSAERKGYINIVTDDAYYAKKKKIAETEPETEETTAAAEIDDIGEEQEEDLQLDLQNDSNVKSIETTKEVIQREEDKEAKPVVWDFLKQKPEAAQAIPNASRMNVPVEPEESDEEKEEPIKEESVKKEIKPAAKNKKGNSKKNGNKKVSTVKPVGTAKPEKSAEESIIELDSRGNPVSKASDAFQHFIDGLTEEKEQE